MLLALADQLGDSLALIASVLCFRVAPQIAYLAISRRVRRTARIAAIAGYAVLLAVAGDVLVPLAPWFLIGFVYYVVAAGVVYALAAPTKAESREPRRVDRFSPLLVSFGLFVALPGLLMPAVAPQTFLVLGWDLCLKGYSYLADSRNARPGFGACLFFMLVDPTLVFPERGRPVEGGGLAAAGRVGTGTARMLAIQLVEGSALQLASRAASVVGPWMQLLVHGSVRLLLTYGKHSGLASVQIGMTGVCGYRVGERYDYALLARSPADFWARWNMYVGAWTRRYVHLPLSTFVSRSRRASRELGTAISLVLSFAILGGFHDVYTWVAERALTYHVTAFFVANGLVFALWNAGAQVLARTRERTAASGHPQAGRAIASLASRTMFAATFLSIIGIFTR